MHRTTVTRYVRLTYAYIRECMHFLFRYSEILLFAVSLVVIFFILYSSNALHCTGLAKHMATTCVGCLKSLFFFYGVSSEHRKCAGACVCKRMPLR